MGDIEAYLRQKYRTEGSGCAAQYLRNPALSDDENFMLMKPYCGNPFIAPGELGSLSQHQPSFAASFTDEGFFMDEETVMPKSLERKSHEKDEERPTTPVSTAASQESTSPDSKEKSAKQKWNEPSKKQSDETKFDFANMVITKHRALHVKPSELRSAKLFRLKQDQPATTPNSAPVCHTEDQVNTIMKEVQTCLVNPTRSHKTIQSMLAQLKAPERKRIQPQIVWFVRQFNDSTLLKTLAQTI